MAARVLAPDATASTSPTGSGGCGASWRRKPAHDAHYPTRGGIDMPPLNAAARSDYLDRMAAETFDVLVIGGGITGVGVALDAAARGYSVALVEASDFGSATSSKSTKLVHGGIRYLPQFDFALVHEALVERGALLRNA